MHPTADGLNWAGKQSRWWQFPGLARLVVVLEHGGTLLLLGKHWIVVTISAKLGYLCNVHCLAKLPNNNIRPRIAMFLFAKVKVCLPVQ